MFDDYIEAFQFCPTSFEPVRHSWSKALPNNVFFSPLFLLCFFKQLRRPYFHVPPYSLVSDDTITPLFPSHFLKPFSTSRIGSFQNEDLENYEAAGLKDTLVEQDGDAPVKEQGRKRYEVCFQSSHPCHDMERWKWLEARVSQLTGLDDFQGTL